MLQNAYLPAKIGADTAENERHFAEICQKLATTLRVPDRRKRDPRAGAPGERRGLCLGILAIFSQNCANFWRARSRLYQNESLQENMRSTAFFKLYKMCRLLHRCNLKNLAKNRFD